MNMVKHKIRRFRHAIETYKAWRLEALQLIESEADKSRWFLLAPGIKELNCLPYITAKWIAGERQS